MNVLEINQMSISFGELHAVQNFSLDIAEKQIVGLIGPNGAGKTTVFNLITGVYKATSGTIDLDGKSINELSNFNRAKAGLGRTFQNIRLFKNLTVLDNIMVAFHHQIKYSAFESVFRLKRYREEEKKFLIKAEELLTVFNLQESKLEYAKNLPYGMQRKLEIARALAENPKVLLLDEPAAGMNEQETKELMNLIKFVRDKYNVAILLIEHDMKLVMGICEKITVINYGQIIASGDSLTIQNNPEVIKAYLGGE